MDTIAVLVPSRKRYLKLKRMVNSLLTTARSNIKIYCYLDDDDDEIENYRKLKNIDFTIGERISISKSWNIIAKKAYDEGADILIMGNDDVIYRTLSWDTILLNHIQEYPHKYYCMWFSDGIKNERHCTFPIVSKEWFKLLDYTFTPGIFNHQFNDTWIFDIAKRAGVCHYIQEVFTQHVHPSYFPNEVDETYANLVDNSFLQKDRIIFDGSESIRAMLADRIKAKINENSNI
jgi:hypothetical protein